MFHFTELNNSACRSAAAQAAGSACRYYPLDRGLIYGHDLDAGRLKPHDPRRSY
jgi:hypothetical protein